MDLRCWMALATRALATIGSNLGLPSKGGAGIQHGTCTADPLHAVQLLSTRTATNGVARSPDRQLALWPCPLQRCSPCRQQLLI